MENIDFSFLENDTELDCTEKISKWQRLWMQVIRQAFIDANSTSRKRIAIRARAQAQAWLSSDSCDLREVLSNAGFDADHYDISDIRDKMLNTSKEEKINLNRFRRTKRRR